MLSVSTLEESYGQNPLTASYHAKSHSAQCDVDLHTSRGGRLVSLGGCDLDGSLEEVWGCQVALSNMPRRRSRAGWMHTSIPTCRHRLPIRALRSQYTSFRHRNPKVPVYTSGSDSCGIMPSLLHSHFVIFTTSSVNSQLEPNSKASLFRPALLSEPRFPWGLHHSHMARMRWEIGRLVSIEGGRR